MARESSFCYSDVSQQIQTRFGSNPSELLVNLTTGMEMIGFSKNHHLQNHESSGNNTSFVWKGLVFDNKTATNNHHSSPGVGSGDGGGGGGGGASSSKAINQTDYYHHEQNHENLMTEAVPWHENRSSSLIVDDSSGLRCVFNERPSQGLSLSLSSTDPSSIGLQSFELKHTAAATSSHIADHFNPVQEELRFMDSTSSSVRDPGVFGKSPASLQQQQVLQDGFFAKSATLHQYHQTQHHQQQHQAQFQLRNSKFLKPTQQLLNEFCSLGPNEGTDHIMKQKKSKQWSNDGGDDDGGGGSSSSKNKSLYTLEFMELQKRKRKLLSMLEEVERRYRHYCDQMKSVVSSFEAIAGSGAASAYSALASKAMSRHFRSLKDGIVTQLQETKKAMGEKDPAAPGTTKGETPSLKIIDQTLRQQRAFQQMTMMESHSWRPQRGLPERSVSVLRAWLFEHFLQPYPTDVDKHILARQTGLSRSQVSNWFINARVRLWKPMIEEMYNEETKEEENINTNMKSSDDIMGTDHLLEDTINIVNHEQKPTHDQLVRIDSECLSSIITNNNNDKNEASRSSKPYQNPNMLHHPQQLGAFGAVELDFSSYNHHPGTGGVSYGGGGGGGGGVSLTLGLQQHHGGGSGSGHGVSLAFSPNSSQSSLFYSRDHIDDCTQVHEYSILDGDQGQALPYRNLMGAQLLHDLAG